VPEGAQPLRHPLGVDGRQGRAGDRRMRVLPRDLPDVQPDHGTPHAPRDRPEPDARRLHRADPLSGAQLGPAQHDGLGHGEAGPRSRIRQLPATARHSRPPAPLPAGPAAPDSDDALRALHRAAGGPELRGRRPLLRGVQHAGRARLFQGGDRPWTRPLVVLPNVSGRGTQVPRRPGGPLRDPPARRRGRSGRHGVPEPRRGRPHLPRARSDRRRRAGRQDEPPPVS